MAVDVTELVPGDVVRLAVGDVVPADLRLLRVRRAGVRRGGAHRRVAGGGEAQRSGRGAGVARWTSRSCAFMGTVVRDGSGLGVVVRTGGRTEFGAIALQLGERQPQTAFQLGLRDFSLLLVRVTAVLAGSILVINVVLGRSLLESVLFALAIAVGLTPQLLPAIVTISLSTGAKRLAERAVVVKRLVSIEDLGNIVVLFTDKTGTLTEGRITFAAALDAAGRAVGRGPARRAALQRRDVLRRARGRRQPARPGALGGAGRARRPAPTARGASPAAPSTTSAAWRRCSSKVPTASGRSSSRARPRSVLARCASVAPEAQAVLDAQFAAGSRVIAVATRAARRPHDA